MSIIDTVIDAVEDKFKHLSVLNEKFGVLLSIYELQNNSFEELLQKCLILETTHDNSRDVDGTDLSNELQIIARRISVGHFGSWCSDIYAPK